MAVSLEVPRPGGPSGERGRANGGRTGEGQSVLDVVPSDLVAFMVAQYFIKGKSRGF